jgi:hypothetical protein
MLTLFDAYHGIVDRTGIVQRGFKSKTIELFIAVPDIFDKLLYETLPSREKFAITHIVE